VGIAWLVHAAGDVALPKWLGGLVIIIIIIIIIINYL